MSLIELNSCASNDRIAVVLFNLGGPDSLEAVQPFLKNLFSDPAIIQLPQPFRGLLAKLISKGRSKKAEKIYQRLGGKSPLLQNTQVQQQALEQSLNQAYPTNSWRVFVAMRYWHPMTPETVALVKAYNPSKIILLPLYPQFSTTTTASSLKAWYEEADHQSLRVPTFPIGCYPCDNGFISAYKELLFQELTHGAEPVRILFSAHGIPQKLVDQGDPYQFQVEQSIEAVMRSFKNDYAVCYQSKVGPLTWLGPSLDQELERAARDQVGVVIVPITFVSEHSETLIELDQDYAQRAQELKLPSYRRLSTVGHHPHFIKGLTDLVIRSLMLSSKSQSLCPPQFSKCGCRVHE
jgi:protoporphyrin/coproporphyrin ferrochelatase